MTSKTYLYIGVSDLKLSSVGKKTTPHACHGCDVPGDGLSDLHAEGVIGISSSS